MTHSHSLYAEMKNKAHKAVAAQLGRQLRELPPSALRVSAAVASLDRLGIEAPRNLCVAIALEYQEAFDELVAACLADFVAVEGETVTWIGQAISGQLLAGYGETRAYREVVAKCASLIPDLAARIVHSLNLKGETDLALETARILRERASDEAYNLHRQAMTLVALGAYGEADQLLSKAIEHDPLDAPSYQALGMIRCRAGVVGNEETPDTARWLFMKAASLRPWKPHAWVEWARSVWKYNGPGEIGRRHDARWIFKEGVENCGDDSVIRCWAMLEQENEFQNGIANGPFCTRALYKLLTARNPGGSVAWRAWGIFEARAAQHYGSSENPEPESARWLLTKAVEADPKDSASWVARGRLETGKHYPGLVPNFVLAEKCFERAIAADPENIHAYSAWLPLLKRQGRWPQARTLLERGIEIARANDDQNSLVQFLSDYAEVRWDDPSLQETVLDEALAIEPQNGTLWSRLGWILVGRVIELRRPVLPTPDSPDDALLEAVISFQDQSDQDGVRKVGWLPHGKVALLNRDYHGVVPAGALVRVRLLQRRTFAIATPIGKALPSNSGIGTGEVATPAEGTGVDEPSGGVLDESENPFALQATAKPGTIVEAEFLEQEDGRRVAHVRNRTIIIDRSHADRVAHGDQWQVEISWSRPGFAIAIPVTKISGGPSPDQKKQFLAKAERCFTAAIRTKPITAITRAFAVAFFRSVAARSQKDGTARTRLLMLAKEAEIEADLTDTGSRDSTFVGQVSDPVALVNENNPVVSPGSRKGTRGEARSFLEYARNRDTVEESLADLERALVADSEDAATWTEKGLRLLCVMPYTDSVGLQAERCFIQALKLPGLTPSDRSRIACGLELLVARRHLPDLVPRSPAGDEMRRSRPPASEPRARSLPNARLPNWELATPDAPVDIPSQRRVPAGQASEKSQPETDALRAVMEALEHAASPRAYATLAHVAAQGSNGEALTTRWFGHGRFRYWLDVAVRGTKIRLSRDAGGFAYLEGHHNPPP